MVGEGWDFIVWCGALAILNRWSDDSFVRFGDEREGGIVGKKKKKKQESNKLSRVKKGKR